METEKSKSVETVYVEEVDGLLYVTPDGGTMCFFDDEETGHYFRIHRFAGRKTGIVTEWDYSGNIIDKSHYH